MPWNRNALRNSCGTLPASTEMRPMDNKDDEDDVTYNWKSALENCRWMESERDGRTDTEDGVKLPAAGAPPLRRRDRSAGACAYGHFPRLIIDTSTYTHTHTERDISLMESQLTFFCLSTLHSLFTIRSRIYMHL